MTTAQDQQSRADFEAWATSKGIQLTRDIDGEVFHYPLTKAAWAAWQAARSLPAPENVREGEPYDNPAFEDLARTMGVWGTAQAALCAQFFLAGRGAVPAGVAPVAWIDMAAWPPIRWVEGKVRADYRDLDGMALYTAAQVLAMGRVPPDMLDAGIPGNKRSPFETDAIAVNLMRLAGLNKHKARECEEVVRLVLAAAPQPPVAPATTGPQAVTAGAGGVTTGAAQLAPLTDERIRQLDDATKFHESHDWSVRFARAIEAEVRKQVTP